MKNIIITLISTLAAFTAAAQSRLLISAAGALGFAKTPGGIVATDDAQVYTGGRNGFMLGLNVGTELNNWRLEAGLQYFEAGFECTGGKLRYQPSSFATPAPWFAVYPHIAVPLRAGYVAHITKNFRVIPSVGLTAAVRTGEEVLGTVPDDYDYTFVFVRESFQSKYTPVSLWGSFGLSFERTIVKRFSFFAGPSFQFVLSNSEHQHIMNVNAGFIARIF